MRLFKKELKWIIGLILLAIIVSCGSGGSEDKGKEPDIIGKEATILSPENDSTIHIHKEFTLEGKALGADGNPITGENIRWKHNANELEAKGETISLVLESVGEHTITLTAIDSNKEEYQDTITVICSQTEVTIRSPDKDDLFHQSDLITFEGEATDYKGQSLVGKLIWSTPGNPYLGEGNKFDIGDFPPGNHMITLTATDNEGNKGSAKVPVKVGKTEVSILSPNDNTLIPASTDIITFNGSAFDYEGNRILKKESLEWLSSDNKVLGTGSPFDTSLPAGRHFITFRATDDFGYTGEAKASVIVREALALIDSPENNSQFLLSDPVVLSGSAKNAAGNAVAENLTEWWLNDTISLGTGSNPTAKKLERGTHTISFLARDGSGKEIARAERVVSIGATRVEWLKQFDYQNNESGRDVKISPKGDIFVAGNSIINNSQGGSFLYKFDDSGNGIWYYDVFLNDKKILFHDISLLGSNESLVSVTEYTPGTQKLTWLSFLEKGWTKSNIGYICSRPQAYKLRMEALGLCLDPSREYRYTAYYSWNDQLSIEKSKLLDGTPEWLNSDLFDRTDRVTDMKVDSEGNLFITGNTTRNLDHKHPDNITPSIFLVKVTKEGIHEWTWQSSHPKENQSTAIALYDPDPSVTGDTLCYLTGFTYGRMYNAPAEFGKKDAFVAQFDSFGKDPRWVRLIGTPEDDKGSDIVVDKTGEILISGHVAGNWGDLKIKGATDIMVAKFNDRGELQWNDVVHGKETDYVTAMAMDSKGDLVLSGQTSGGLLDQIGQIGTDAFLLKLNLTQ